MLLFALLRFFCAFRTRCIVVVIVINAVALGRLRQRVGDNKVDFADKVYEYRRHIFLACKIGSAATTTTTQRT